MHLVLDLQACQSESRFRGIGRFSLSLAKAIAAQPHHHEITILLNGAMEEAIEDMRHQFSGLVPQSRIKTWDALAPTAYMYPENRFRLRASEALRLQVLRELKPDLVHVASLFEGWTNNVIATIPAEVGYATASTLYDLIPLAHRKTYLVHSAVRAWYTEKVKSLQRSDMLLGISKYSCMEAHQLLGVPADRIANISGAADGIFRRLEDAEASRAEVMARYHLRKPFIMYAGGFDPRKNIAALISAFLLLPSELRALHQLAIVGNVLEHEYQELTAHIASLGLQAEEVVFTGYVSDHDLVKLYNLCELYVFPSLQEGFGLPILEAMQCGAVVIGSDTSSLPEVLGRADALFDPRDEGAIAKKMTQALTDQAFRASLREHARRQPAKFTWQESARRALDAFEAANERSCSKTAMAVVQKPKPLREKIAFLPAPRSQEAIIGVGKEVTVYTDPDCGGTTGMKSRSLEQFRRERDRFSRVIVELSDDPYCAKTLALAAEGDADLLLAGPNMGSALAPLATQRATRQLLSELLYRSKGYPAVRTAIETDFSADALARLVTAEGLAGLAGCQVWRDKDRTESPDATSWRQRTREALAGFCELEGMKKASEQDLDVFASAVARTLSMNGASKQWLIDISNLCIRDAGTGIQRVVRHVLDELMFNPPAGYRIEPVYLDADGIFRYARNYCERRYFSGLTLPADEPVEFGDADIYLGLDLGAHVIPVYKNAFRELRNRGIKLYFVVYDLLPIMRSDCFDPPMVPVFRAWSDAIAELADGIVCISRSVADEFERWLHQARPVRKRPLGIGYFHLGADLGPETTLTRGDPDDFLGGLDDQPTFLMVGTIEPRKGHAQALGAFEHLWSRGTQANLLLVGKPGWLSETTIEKLRDHQQRGKRLWWIENADDELLREAYRRASALLMASEGEGFGLPLIEAAHHGLPLIARDLPVFREVAGEHAFYFSGLEPNDLADALEEWLRLKAEGRSPQPGGIKWLTWSESAAQLVDVVRKECWTHTWQAGMTRRHPAYDHRLQTHVGRLVRGRLQTTARPGWLLYGPCLPLQAGRYRVRLLGGWNAAHGSAWAGVAVGTTATPIVRKSMSPVVSNAPSILIELDVMLQVDVPDYQVRVFVDEHASFWIDEVLIEPWPLVEGRCSAREDRVDATRDAHSTESSPL